MATAYTYKVKDRTGKIVTGALEGGDERAVITKLRQQGYVILNLREKNKTGIHMELSLPFLTKRVKTKDLTIFSRQFATMINSGLSLTRSLGILAEQTKNSYFSQVITQVGEDVQAGQPLSDAFARHTRAFPQLYVTMVRAGETGGVLDTVLLRVAEHFESEAQLKGKIKSAAAYPAAVFSFTVLIAFAMITFIVPMFVKMFESFDAELPLPTRVMLGLSASIRGYWWLYLLIFAGSVYGFRRFKKLDQGRLVVDQMKLRLPVFGMLFRKIAISRFSRTLGTLIATGVSVLQALEIVAETSGNAVVAKAVMKSRKSIKEGETIAKPLTKSRVFPPMVTQMIAVGEETGALEKMLGKIADFYDSEVSATVNALTSLIEPLLIIVMGVVIAGILISLYLSMFSVVNLIK